MATQTKTPTKTETNGHANSNGNGHSKEYQPILNQRGPIIQDYGTVRDLPQGLDSETRIKMCEYLNQVLADTITLAHMYKKHHWQVSGPTFYQLHLLFDKHYTEQTELVDAIAERIQLLGGVATGMPAAVAKLSKIENPPDGVEEVPVQISRLLEAHKFINEETRDYAGKADDAGDDGTNDMLVSQVLRVNELQVWFIATHMAPEPLVRANN